MKHNSVVVAGGPGNGARAIHRMLVENDHLQGSHVALPSRSMTRQERLCNEAAYAIRASPGTSRAKPPRAPENAAHPELARLVLVVEDNPVNQLVAARMLQKRGLEVEVAVNGRRALEMHQRSTYDAIFMDCQMPELDGYETTREIRRREGSGRHTPIIAMTASTMPGDHERCLAAGMDFYTGKPISPAGLDYAIARSLASG
jgi:CheY-like chemotaxis protein